jgi:predicted house-cleaning noncanonical NTP pyrophosphatase (MazG superfamily)
MKEYNKLVRDRVPEIIKDSGETPHIKILSDDTEYMMELYLKLDEEVDEFKENLNIVELADVLEVVYSLGKCFNVSEKELDAIRQQKALSRGGFEGRTYLTSVEDKKNS